MIGVLVIAAVAVRVTIAGRREAEQEERARREADAAKLLLDLAAWDAATTEERSLAAKSAERRAHGFTLTELAEFSAGGASHQVAIFRHAESSLDFVLVPGGSFSMGSSSGEPDRGKDESPHRVVFTKPLLMCRTECTESAFARVLQANPPPADRAALPVEAVSWHRAQEFCRKSGLTLPTEAQWEYACRAGTTTAYSTGDDAASPLSRTRSLESEVPDSAFVGAPASKGAVNGLKPSFVRGQEIRGSGRTSNGRFRTRRGSGDRLRMHPMRWAT